MGDESDESAWAFDVVGALKAKVDAVKESEAAVRQREQELEEERESLEAARARLAEKEQALLRLDEDIARQREGVHDRKSDVDRARESIAQGHERLAANEARLKEWAQSLHNAEQQIVTLRDDLKARQAEAAMKLAQFHDRLVAVMRREDAIADREVSLAESLERMKKVGEAVIAREKVLAGQVQALGGLQKEWSTAIRRRDEELANALAALADQGVVEVAGDAEVTSLIEGLHAEATKLAEQRQALVGRERKAMEFEQSLTAVVGAVRPGVEQPAAPVAVPSVSTTQLGAPSDTRERAPEQPIVKPDTSPKLLKGPAMQKMARVLELAKKAQAEGRDTAELREQIRQLRKAYEAKNWEGLDAQAQRTLDILALVTPPS